VTTALDAISREPQVNWMSAPARALLAVALADGRPLRVITVLDDAAILVHAEHAIRCEGIQLRDALDRARTTSIAKPTLRGIVRFAAALSDDSAELDALLMEHEAADVRSLTRDSAVRIAIQLFARKQAPRGITFEQLVDGFAKDDVPPAELVDDPGKGDLVGRCNECNGAVNAGAATIAIGWPIGKPVWHTFIPSLARPGNDDHASSARPPARNSKLRALLAGELQTLCTPCAMKWKYASVEMRPPGALIEADSLEPHVVETAATLPSYQEPRQRVTSAAASERGHEIVGGLIDRERTIATAVGAIVVDHRRLAAVVSAVKFVNDDAELRYRILAIAWQLDRPLRIKTLSEDGVRLDELVDRALRGGSVERALERT